MKKLCTKWFRKWAKKAKLSNTNLVEAIKNLERGASTADLGDNLYKIRVSRAGKGKSSGFRTIIVYKKEEKAIFLYGFGKNDKANIDRSELRYFKKLGRDLLELRAGQINESIEKRILFNLEREE